VFKNKWKTSFFIALFALVVSNVFWLYFVVDQAISYGYLSDEYQHKTASVKGLGELIVKGSQDYEQKDILYLLRQANPDSFIVEEGSEIHTDFGTFVFENSKLVLER
jgi:hypothetical protein